MTPSTLKKEYLLGMRDSLPIFTAYFAVSFGFGAAAVAQGITALFASLISLCNLTSAGQFAGLTVMKNAEPLINMFLTQLVINSRYALMGLSLNQKMGNSIGKLPRFFFAFHITDEIFATAINRQKPLTTAYMFGLGILPIFGWTAGTALGAMASSVLPASIQTALGTLLYGMFVAIVMPDIKRSRPMLIVAGIAVLTASLFRFVPFLNEHVDGGLVIVIATVIAAAVGALLFPISDTPAPDADDGKEADA